MFWQPSEEKHSLKLDDFVWRLLFTRILCMSHTECLFVAESRVSQKEKKHWLWMMDGQHLFYSWKWKKDHNAFTCTMTQNINNHGFIFQFWVNFRFKTLAQAPMGLLQCIIILLNFPYYPKKKFIMVRKETFFFFLFGE